jgi:hypothetical protein
VGAHAGAREHPINHVPGVTKAGGVRCGVAVRAFVGDLRFFFAVLIAKRRTPLLAISGASASNLIAPSSAQSRCVAGGLAQQWITLWDVHGGGGSGSSAEAVAHGPQSGIAPSSATSLSIHACV